MSFSVPSAGAAFSPGLAACLLRPPSRQSRLAPAPAAEPIERLGASLRRLRTELELTETRQGLLAKNHRVQALRGAYIDTLGAACKQLEVPSPACGDRASLAEIYRAEAALRQRGLDVRETAVR